MALAASIGYLCVVLAIASLAIASGTRLLQWFSLPAEEGLETALYAAGLFFAALEVVLFALAMLGWLRREVVLTLLVAMAILAGKHWAEIPKLARALASRTGHGEQPSPMWLVKSLVLLSLGISALMAMAPLTGSDAMHYHFTVPMLEQGHPWRPIFFIANSFFVGQSHLLISLGMALGSDHIALGLIYLGGLLASGAVWVLARKLIGSDAWAWLTVLAFVLTPMVYWQAGTSGSPDIWMAFFTTLAVLAAARGVRTSTLRWWFLAALFAGVVAGSKYTGWAVPLALVGCCLAALRSLKWATLCGLWTLPTGIPPLLRNALWTGDPAYPFLAHWLAPGRVNAYALASVVADTHSAGLNRSLPGMLGYFFSMALKGNTYGVGQYFGPLVLAFAPLLLLVLRCGFLPRAAAATWALVLVTNALTCQMARFLLPIFPLALALVLAGMAASFQRKWWAVQVACAATLFVFLGFGISTEVLYAKDFLPVALGLESRNNFLVRMAPDYGATAFVNQAVGTQGIVMVFFRHLYYLDPAFIEGNPANSWLMDPRTAADPGKLLSTLQQFKVRWVVKSPDYPEPLAASFQELEDEGKLRPVCSKTVSTFSEFRVYGQRVTQKLILLEVMPSR